MTANDLHNQACAEIMRQCGSPGVDFGIIERVVSRAMAELAPHELHHTNTSVKRASSRRLYWRDGAWHRSPF